MKILYSPIQQVQYFKYQKSSYTKNKNTSPLPSFKSSDEYSSEIESLARKYQYVLNPRTYIFEEISPSAYCADGVERVLNFIKQLNDKEKLKNQKLLHIDNDINMQDAKRNEIQQQDKELLKKINKIQIENVIDKIKLQKILMSEQRKKQVCTELKTKYIDLFELENKMFPNGIMIKGLDSKDEQDYVIDFLRSNNCTVLRLDFGKISRKEAIKNIFEAKNKIKDSKEHSVLIIDNFAKYMIDNDENFTIINNLKSTLSSCAKTHNMTILVFESNPERLDENIIGKHRFQKEIDVLGLNKDKFCEFMPIYDGLRMVFDDNEDATLDLFLGDFGYNKNVLWINSTNENKIQAVIDRLEEIKKTNMFKNIKYIQCEKPDSLENLKDFHSLNKRSKDFKIIYEKRL